VLPQCKSGSLAREKRHAFRENPQSRFGNDDRSFYSLWASVFQTFPPTDTLEIGKMLAASLNENNKTIINNDVIALFP